MVLNNKQNSNQLKLGVILSYAQILLNILIQLAYTPLMIRILGKNEYGVYTLVASVVSYLSLFSLGFTGAYMRFHTRAQAQSSTEENKVNGLFLMLFIAMSVCAFICGMVLSMFPQQIFGAKLTSEELSTAQVLMKILVVNIALSFIAGLFDSFIISREKFVFQRGIMLAGTIVNPFVTLPLLLTGHGSVAIVLVTTCITVFKLVVNIYYALKVLAIKFIFKGMDIQLLKELAVFSFFIFLNMLIDQINWNVDKLILGHSRGSSEIALYSVGAQINSLYIMFSSTISNVFVPRVNKIALDEDIQKRNAGFTDIFIKVGRIQFAVLFLICSGFVLWGHYFITHLYAGAEYSDSYWVALLLIVPVTIPLIQNLGIEIQRSINKHKFRSIAYLAMAILNIGVSIPLANRFGAIGTAMGTAIGVIIANGFIMNWYYSKKIGIDIKKFWVSILSFTKGLIIPVIAGIGLKFIIGTDELAAYIIEILLYILIYTASIWKFGMNEYEKKLFGSLLLKITHLRRS